MLIVYSNGFDKDIFIHVYSTLLACSHHSSYPSLFLLKALPFLAQRLDSVTSVMVRMSFPM